MEFPKPQQEHAWLNALLGEWTFEHSCSMGPDQPPFTAKGRERVRSLGGMWFIAESEGETPGGGTSQNIMTLGYDPQGGKYVGTFISSAMTFLWIYSSGRVEGNTLRLLAEGPDFNGKGMAQYRDSIALVSPGERTLISEMQLPDGSWQQFMQARYVRVK